MSQSLWKSQPPVWLVNQHLFDDVEHVLPLLVLLLLQQLRDVVQQVPAVLADVLPVQVLRVPVQAAPFKQSDPRLLSHPSWNPAQYPLHHRQVFPVLVCLEESVAECNFIDDATNGPDVAGLGPANLQDHLWSPVVPGGHNQRVMLVVKSCRAKVYQSDLGIFQDADSIFQFRG